MNRSERAVEIALSQTDNAKSLSVLDLGCGFGETLQLLSDAGFLHLTGVEHSKETIEQTKVLLDNTDVALIQGDGERTVFEDNSFDIILCLDVLEHVQSDTSVAKEIKRLLKPGGLFIGSTPYKGASFILDPENMRHLMALRKPTHHHYTRKELRALFSNYIPNIAFERRGVGLSQIVFLTTYVLLPFAKERIMKIRKRISHWEFAKSFGPLSYHVIFFGKKSDNEHVL